MTFCNGDECAMEHARNSVESKVPKIPQKRNTESIKPHRFKKGQSGNPGGRPRRITDRVEKHLAKRVGKGRTRVDEFAEAMVERAIKGDTPIAKEIWARMEARFERRGRRSGRAAGWSWSSRPLGGHLMPLSFRFVNQPKRPNPWCAYGFSDPADAECLGVRMAS
jgi:hypothetical protein